MKIRTCTPHHLTQNKWFHLGFSIILAFLLALVLLFIPITAGTTPIPAPGLLQSEPIPFGIALVHAANGVTLTKSAALTVTPGGVLTYTLTVTNGTGGTLNPAEVVVKEEAPTNTTLDCSSAQTPPGWAILPPYCSTSAITWGLVSTMAAGDSVDLIISVNVDDPLSGGYIVNDKYYVSYGGPFVEGPPFTTTVYAPSWEITKTVSSDAVEPGQYLTYTITITNNGSVATSGQYTITDQLPNDTNYVTGSASDGGYLDGSNLIWPLSDPVGAGQAITVSYVVTVTTPLAGGTPIVNQTYNVGGGGVYTSTTAGDPITVTVNSPATLSISKIASSDPITVSEVLTFTITVTNNATSTGPAEGVIVTDILPDEVIYQSAGFVGAATGIYTDSGDPTILWELTNPLGVGASAQVTVTVQVTDILPSPPVMTNTYKASASNAPLVSDAMTVSVKADDVDNVTLLVSPDTLNNLCETTVATATVVDRFNNPVSDASVTIGKFTGTGDISPNSDTGNTNEAGIFTVTFRGIKDGAVNMIASSGIESGGDTLTINQGTPLPTNLNLTVSPDPLYTGGATGVVTGTLTDCQSPTPQPVPGKPVTFTLSNVGLATFPGPSGSANGNTDANGNLTATLTSTSTQTANGTLTITGTSEGTGWSLQDTVTLTIQPAPAPVLTITKTANPADGNTLNPGGTINYTIRVTNTGNADATDVSLTDTLPLSVSYVSLISSTTGGGSISGPSRNGNIVVLSLSKLEPAKTLVATIEVTVTATVSGTNLSNFANTKSDATNLVTSNIVAHTVVTTTASPGNKVYLPIILKQ